MTEWTLTRIIVEVIGWLGAIALLAGYYLIQTQTAKHDDLLYILLNIIGAIFLTINTLYHRAYPSVVTNLIWAMIGSFIAIKLLFTSNNDEKAENFEFR